MDLCSGFCGDSSDGDTTEDEKARLVAASCPLPPWARQMLEEGLLFAVFILSSVYVPLVRRGNPNPKFPAIGDTVEVKLPKDAETKSPTRSLHPRLFGLYGSGFHSAALWLGDEAYQGKCIHVVLQPAYKADVPLLLRVGLVKCHALFGDKPMRITEYVKDHVKALWLSEDGQLRDRIFGPNGWLAKFPGYTWIFSGASHGASMAQVLALLFAQELEKLSGSPWQTQVADIRLVSWNGYRWTGEDGRNEMLRTIGDRQVNFVACSQHGGHFADCTVTCQSGVEMQRFDPTAGFPAHCVNVPGLYLLDIDESMIHGLDRLPNSNPVALPKRWYALHFAQQYLRAMAGLCSVYCEEAVVERETLGENPHEQDMAEMEADDDDDISFSQ